MKTITKITTLSIALFIAGIGMTSAQYGRYQRTLPQRQLMYCMDVPGLTDQQIEKLNVLNENHRKTMDELRLNRQTAATVTDWNEYGAKMLLEQNEHLKQVQSVLTDEQKEYFLANQFNAGRPINAAGRGLGPCGGGQMRGPGRGAGFGRGAGMGRGRGFYWR